jgi:hypothetical protein
MRSVDGNSNGTSGRSISISIGAGSLAMVTIFRNDNNLIGKF